MRESYRDRPLVYERAATPQTDPRNFLSGTYVRSLPLRIAAITEAAGLEQLLGLLALVDGMAVVHRAGAENLRAAERGVHLCCGVQVRENHSQFTERI